MAKKKSKKKWMQGARKEMEKKGTVGSFTAQAKKAGMSPLAFARKVLANPKRYSPTTVKRANFALNANKRKRKSKK